MNHKFCRYCGQVKPASEFGPNKAQASGLATYCRPCTKAYRNTEEYKAKRIKASKAWYAKNAERERKRALDKYHANPEPVREKRKKVNRDPAEYARHVAGVTARSRRIKAEVFAYYGTCCTCCGESNPGFLTIDHINGCTREERKEHGLGSRFYRWLKKNGFPEGFRTQCFNCNIGRSHLDGICPHHIPDIDWAPPPPVDPPDDGVFRLSPDGDCV
jgi:ribosomal protein L44E